MNPADWIDTGAVPPRALPATVEAALAYLAETLGHPVYAHWTLTRIKRRYGSLADAKAAQPTVLNLLLAHDGAVEYWERGRLRAAPADQAPSPETVLTRLLLVARTLLLRLLAARLVRKRPALCEQRERRREHPSLVQGGGGAPRVSLLWG